jgi:hypothetical protein
MDHASTAHLLVFLGKASLRAFSEVHILGGPFRKIVLA